MWRLTRHGRVVRWDPPDCWHLRPRHRLTLFAGKTAAGGPHSAAVD